jgi:hypothetical protein
LIVVSGPDGAIVRRINDPLAFNSDRLGWWAVVPAGDVDGDHVPDILAGIWADVAGKQDAGAVLVISGASGAVMHRCTDPLAPASENFGLDLANIGDVTGDGRADFAASENGRNTPGAVSSGAIAIVSPTDCSIVGRLLDPSPIAGGNLAIGSLTGTGNLTGIGDLTGDGKPDIVAGSDWGARGHLVLFSETSNCESPDNCPLVTNPKQLDSDGDAAGNLCDVCPANADPSQVDTDGDGLGDACDCRATDATSRAPGDRIRVDVTQAGRILWTPAASAEGYFVRRGDIASRGLGSYGLCWQHVTSGAAHAGDAGVVDSVVPPVGSGVFYLVQGDDSLCGKGSLGFDSQERLRVVSGQDVCP